LQRQVIPDTLSKHDIKEMEQSKFLQGIQQIMVMMDRRMTNKGWHPTERLRKMNLLKDCSADEKCIGSEWVPETCQKAAYL